ncbi:MAG: hypothetical protein HY014_13495 [Acidobacteria bacterium]|nr:hypothetical protein [Acidobacteriota bacterium]MBI3489171.1 hypothetical protein [Acidobacteriota bacterium]
MSIPSFIDVVAREHPAFVHVPLGLVAALPLAMLASFHPRHGRLMAGTSLFLGGVGWLASSASLFSGWMWGRQINLIGPSAFLPVVTSEKQALQKILQIHILMASAGFLVGGACVFLLWRSWRRESGSEGGRFWQRGVGAPALLAGLLWLGCWGFCGKLGGIMVFGNEETNKAAAEADAARRNDSEADLPIRALDYGSLEPAESRPSRSQAHGGRWRRIWVTASGIDAYKEGRPLPPGAYAVMCTFTDEKGRPGTEPGPLYMREARADGSAAFAFYWARVPEALRREFGGDSVYWRSPDPRLATCLGCHGKDGALPK